ncbi:hypothetical protein BSP239C_03167 [Brevibacterium sp. 239c]|uniref:hypothetical protein n=1 Tax=Brevibacterium sp. 239c TaxID=1965356 RepID=UPI000C665C49|nr:hypothetical protein [Brevibacterium sp. 239c]SMY01002.1 hypothetical protein BSP239C_03167 [Brevibacterium sp. 239c]
MNKVITPGAIAEFAEKGIMDTWKAALAAILTLTPMNTVGLWGTVNPWETHRKLWTDQINAKIEEAKTSPKAAEQLDRLKVRLEKWISYGETIA